MIVLKKRNCPECGGEMLPKLINLLYKKEQCEIQVEVIGIPANVCTKCFYRIIPGKVAKYIDSLIDPIFESQVKQDEVILPAPHIDIQFPSIERNSYYYDR
jgi:DNA-directed RNA polymerase subunit RPC12/RpoP